MMERKHKKYSGLVIFLLCFIMIINSIWIFEPLQVFGAERTVWSTAKAEAGTTTNFGTTTDTGATTESGQESLKLAIDNQNRYEGMDKTYSDGYVPTVADGKVHIVVPLICKSGSVRNDELSVTMELGDTAAMPFVNKNYNKTIRQQSASVNDGTATKEVYLIDVSLDLKTDRINGSYPVLITVSGTDSKGRAAEQTFTIYVNITDGIDPNAEPATEAVTEEPVTYAPKVLVADCKVSKSQIYAGDEIEVSVTLQNTSKTESIQNMTVTADALGEYFTILSASDSIYIGSIAAGGTTDVVLQYQVNPATPQGQYDLTLNMDYADSKGGTYSGSGNAKLNILQPLSVEFDPIQIVSEAKVADTIDASIQAMNLGRSKIYNVRARLEGDGLNPGGTIFIGDMEPGTTASASTTVYVTALTEGTALYGMTTGTVTYSYEDEAGNEYEQTEEFSIMIQSPFSDTKTEEEEEEPGHWWVIVGVIAGILVLIGVFCLVQWFLRRREREQEDEDITQASEITETE